MKITLKMMMMQPDVNSQKLKQFMYLEILLFHIKGQFLQYLGVQMGDQKLLLHTVIWNFKQHIQTQQKNLIFSILMTQQNQI